jgi:hypothetical protein
MVMCVLNDGLFYSTARGREGISNEHLQAVQKIYTVSVLLIKALSVVGLHELQVLRKAEAELSEVRRSGRPTTADTQASFNALMPRPQTINSDLYVQTFKNLQKRFRRVLPHTNVTELLQHDNARPYTHV